MESNLSAFFAAFAILRHSAVVIAIGFSHKTCAPAFNAAIVIAAWSLFGVQMTTASIAIVECISSSCFKIWGFSNHTSDPLSFAYIALDTTVVVVTFAL